MGFEILNGVSDKGIKGSDVVCVNLICDCSIDAGCGVDELCQVGPPAPKPGNRSCKPDLNGGCVACSVLKSMKFLGN